MDVHLLHSARLLQHSLYPLRRDVLSCTPIPIMLAPWNCIIIEVSCSPHPQLTKSAYAFIAMRVLMAIAQQLSLKSTP